MARTYIARIGVAPVSCAGFYGCSTWLKADTGVTATSTGLISNRDDQTIYPGLSGVQLTSTLMPKYITGSMNSNPVVRFASGNFLAFASKYMYAYDNSEFAVIRTTSSVGVISMAGNSLVVAPALCDRALSLTGGKATALLSGQRITTTTTAINNNKAQLISRTYGTGV